MTMEKTTMKEDVSPIKNGDFPNCHVCFLRGTLTETHSKRQKAPENQLEDDPFFSGPVLLVFLGSIVLGGQSKGRLLWRDENGMTWENCWYSGNGNFVNLNYRLAF